MATISVDVDVYLDEFDTDDLIEELSSRRLSKQEQDDLSDALNEGKKVSQSILDNVKMEIILNGFNTKTLQELEQFFNK